MEVVWSSGFKLKMFDIIATKRLMIRGNQHWSKKKHFQNCEIAYLERANLKYAQFADVNSKPDTETELRSID